MTLARPLRGTAFLIFFVSILAVSCARTEIIESPRTGYVADTGEPKDPAVIWTSRTLAQDFDYLGLVKSSSWSYQGALDRLVEGGRELRADAVVDVHFERVGFLKTMQAFAIKYK